jgi:hypothetical protein
VRFLVRARRPGAFDERRCDVRGKNGRDRRDGDAGIEGWDGWYFFDYGGLTAWSRKGREHLRGMVQHERVCCMLFVRTNTWSTPCSFQKTGRSAGSQWIP